jgi:hypothetical protein
MVLAMIGVFDNGGKAKGSGSNEAFDVGIVPGIMFDWVSSESMFCICSHTSGDTTTPFLLVH